MISIEVNPALELINWKSISEIFQQVNWDERSPQEIEKSFRTASFTCFAMDGKCIVGFGRTVDDGKYYAVIVDVVIHPNYQSKGIGTSIVNMLKNKLRGYQFITLTAAPKKEGFYQKLGWKNQKSAYIYPKDEKQTREHCE